MKNKKLSRRSFIQSVVGASISGSALYATLGSLGASRVLAADADDYKSLVCIFMLGGNDGFNTLVPTSTAEYNEYAAARQNLALAQADLLPISPLNNDGASYGLHPGMPGIQSLFNNGDIAFSANVGALVAPTTRNDYVNSSVALPPNLFSHNSQQNFWQSVEAFEAQKIGWGGRMADILNTVNPDALLPLNISLSGSNLLQVGSNTTSFNTSSNGAIDYAGFWRDRRRDLVRSIYTENKSHLFETAFSETLDRSISYSEELSVALENTPAPATTFTDSKLSANLKAVAHMIAARNELKMNRQVFFVGFGGFDTHDTHLNRHAGLLEELDAGLTEFQQEMVAIGCHNSVTTFTASDFGRTLTSNGDGSDHGWGSHHLIMGGAVNGQHIHGEMPPLVIDGPQDTGRGRIIPTLSVDQYGATLAKWLGVADNDLDTIFPNLTNFNQRDIGLFS